jgi:ferredoxin
MLRRAFMEKITTLSAFLAAGAFPFGLARMLAPVRPTAEKAPPLGAIRFHTRDGGNRVNTPYINPEITACTLCGACMEVCPTETLSVTPIREVKMGIAQIDRDACYPWVDKGICGACTVVCPLGKRAIRFSFANIYRPVVMDGCVGCGLCVEVCPHPSLPIRIVESALADAGPGLTGGKG